jgi:hypothetical protein
MRIRSQTDTICGEVYRPTLAEGARVVKREEQKADVEPYRLSTCKLVSLDDTLAILTLPLVPVTWIT